MNQILFFNSYDNNLIKKYHIKKKSYYFSIFVLSLCTFCLILLYTIYNRFKTFEKHSYSNKLLSQYNINTLYSFHETQNTIQLSNDISIIGLIEIPKINITYPILSTSNENLLKISVCRFCRSTSK